MTFTKKALVLGAGGFIGNHMVTRLRSEGYWVRGIDVKYPESGHSDANQFGLGDLRDREFVRRCINYIGPTEEFSDSCKGREFDEIYQFAADMGGAGYVFTGDNDAAIMFNSVAINMYVLEEQKLLNEQINKNTTKIFYSSSACIYPEHNQLDPNNPDCRESTAYPANPDSEYGWEKLFSERMYQSYARNHAIPVRIARYHNIYGPKGTWDGGKEKAPAAICRKVAQLPAEGGTIDVWGDGTQTRSFLYIDECIEATRRLMTSDFMGPVNIGSEEMVTINQLVDTVASIAGKTVTKNYIAGPTGVAGRNSNNTLLQSELNWNYSMSLAEGLAPTYAWIAEQVAAAS